MNCPSCNTKMDSKDFKYHILWACPNCGWEVIEDKPKKKEDD